MTRTMSTRPVDLYLDAAREEIDFENRQACADARAEFDHAEAVRHVCEVASAYLNAFLGDMVKASPLLREIRADELDREFIGYRGTLELMTGETWPAQLPAFLAKCDSIARGDEDVAA